MKHIPAYLGLSLQILAVLLIVPALAAHFWGEPLIPFFIPCVSSFILGGVLSSFFERKDLTIAEALIFASVLFITMSAVGSIPYLLTPTAYTDFVDAYFESMSGFTTTGLTVIQDIEAQPRSLILWRSMTQWIGGIGIIVMFLTMLMNPGMSAYYLYKAEGKEERIWPSIVKTAREQFFIYSFYTLVGIALLAVIGPGLFHAAVHMLSMVSTGGFSSQALSIEALERLGNPYLVDTVVLIFMIIGSVSFVLHSKVLHGDIKQYVKNKEAQLFYALILLFTAILSVELMNLGDANFLRHSVFQVVSALTTTGFVNTNIEAFSDLGKYVLIVLMILGGSSGSTSGGLKMIRVGLLLRSIPWYIRRSLLPKDAVVPLKFGNLTFDTQEALTIALYAVTYVAFIAAGTTVLMFDSFSFTESLFEVASAVGTVGMSLGITSSLSAISKVVIILGMLIGRLEIIPVFGVFFLFTKTKRYL